MQGSVSVTTAAEGVLLSGVAVWPWVAGLAGVVTVVALINGRIGEIGAPGTPIGAAVRSRRHPRSGSVSSAGSGATG